MGEDKGKKVSQILSLAYIDGASFPSWQNVEESS